MSTRQCAQLNAHLNTNLTMWAVFFFTKSGNLSACPKLNFCSSSQLCPIWVMSIPLSSYLGWNLTSILQFSFFHISHSTSNPHRVRSTFKVYPESDNFSLLLCSVTSAPQPIHHYFSLGSVQLTPKPASLLPYSPLCSQQSE